MVKMLQNSLISDEHKIEMELSHTLKFIECKESLLDLLVLSLSIIKHPSAFYGFTTLY